MSGLKARVIPAELDLSSFKTADRVPALGERPDNPEPPLGELRESEDLNRLIAERPPREGDRRLRLDGRGEVEAGAEAWTGAAVAGAAVAGAATGRGSSS